MSLAFGSITDNTLTTFARNVHTLLYAAAGFPNIPVTAPVLLATIEAFATAKAAQSSGGKAATAEKNNKRDALVIMLKELALYVQVASANNLAQLLATGFDAMSLNRTQYPLSKLAILRVMTGMSGEALVTFSTETIARGCEIRVAEIGADGAPGDFRPTFFSTSSRNIAIEALTPGKLFAYQGRTVGGSTTYSDWSDQIVHRAA